MSLSDWTKGSTTYSNKVMEPLNLKGVMKAMKDLEEKRRAAEAPRKKGWIEKLLNRFGYHKSNYVLIVDKEALRMNYSVNIDPSICMPKPSSSWPSGTPDRNGGTGTPT